MNPHTSLHNINFSDILKLPDGDVQGAEGAGPTNACTAVNHYRRPQFMSVPPWGHLCHHLSLLLPDTLQELQHAQGAVRGPVVRPGGELEVTDMPLLPGYTVGDLEVRHYEVLVVLDIFRLNAVVPTLDAGACRE